jgi:hypothetical protein
MHAGAPLAHQQRAAHAEGYDDRGGPVQGVFVSYVVLITDAGAGLAACFHLMNLCCMLEVTVAVGDVCKVI